MVDAAALLTGLGGATLTAGAAMGGGAGVLAAFGLLGGMGRLESAAWSFAIGFGVLGWVLFFLAVAGWIVPPALVVLAAIALCGLVLLPRRPAARPDGPAPTATWWLLIAALTAVLAVDLMEGLSPPADADSLAYHFALPKQFLAAGRLEFVPRAVDGAIPLLIQMTYLAPLAIGGEIGLTLWTMVSGWMAGLLVYVIACRHMPRTWALATALLFLSAPSMLYSGGAGHVEPRLAAFAVAGAVAMADAVARRDLRLVALAGLAAGFFAGAKYTGPLFAAACALPLFARWRSLPAVATYCAAVCLAGFQWYGWNWIHAGDPAFPVLWRFLGLPDSEIWTAAQDALFHVGLFAGENVYPRSLIWFVAYPFVATLSPDTTIDAGRVGPGPYALLILPFAVAGLWRFRKRLIGHPLFMVGLVCAGFYILWFASGSSQRVRHLIPVYPLLLVCLTAAAVKFGEGAGLRRPLAGAAAAALCVHLAAQAAFGVGYARYLLGGESRAEFLARNVSYYDVVAAVETAMQPGDRVLVPLRQLVYLFDRQVFYYHSIHQAQVTPRIAEHDPERFLKQLRTQRITLILTKSPENDEFGNDLARAARMLMRRGCAERIRRFSATAIESRTLRTLGGENPEKRAVSLYRVKTEECRL